MKDLEVIIGLEIHAQVNTKTKMFCRCDNNAFGKDPNTLVCPICMGFPGMLPSLNVAVLKKSMMASLALSCTVNTVSKFDRKNYFYPDLPKGYQISQFHKPLAQNGFVEIDVEGKMKKIRINRLHIEDDAGKLSHEGGHTYCDYNRSGTPLMEIVTEPDLRSSKEARIFAEELQKMLQYIDASDADMYKGMMRFDASISLRPTHEAELYPRTEIKNLNSFKALEAALEYEIHRQTGLWNSGEPQDHMTTVGWDELLGKTLFMRNKEGAEDYRYFPEPDLPPLELTTEEIEEVKSAMPELPRSIQKRFQTEYELGDMEIESLMASKALADYFEEVVKQSGDKKHAISFILTILLKLLKDDGKHVEECSVDANKMVELIELVNDGTISNNIAKELLVDMYKTNKSAKALVKEKGVKQISGADMLEPICQEVIDANSKIVEDYKGGKDRAFGALVGQVMARTKGQANPKMVNEILKKLIQ